MKILTAVDFSKASEKVLEKTVEMAAGIPSKVWLLHVLEPEPSFVGIKCRTHAEREMLASQYQRECSILLDYKDKLRVFRIEAETILVQGPTVDTIIKEAKKHAADIIIVGSHGKKTIHKMLVGSISEGVLHKADRPVLIVPTHDRTKSV